MSFTTVILLGLTVTALCISVWKDGSKTFESIKKARSMMWGMAGDIIGVLFLIGLILTFIPEETIKKVMGDGSVWLSTLGSAIVGTITLIPAFVAFPLAGSLKDSGASLIAIAAFLTTLTMVGFVTFPLEKRTFGVKFAFLRNGLSFGAALVIALLMGVFL